MFFSTILLSATLAMPMTAQATASHQMIGFGKQSVSLRHAPQAQTLEKMAHRNVLKRAGQETPTGSIAQVESFGLLDAEDGTSWLYTIQTTPSETFAYSYGSAEISLYDNQQNLVTTIHYEVPEGMNVNSIEPFGAVSSKFFDLDSKTKEFTVYIHEVGADYTSIGHILVYNTKGELVKSFDAGNLIWFDATEKWETYQRAILVTEGQTADGQTTTVMSVLKPVAWNNPENAVEHTFELRDDLIEYSYGPCLNTYKVGSQPYYVLSYYEQPFTQGWDENYEILLTPDNNYCVEVYDRDFNQVSNFKVPVTAPEVAYCSTYAVGIYSYHDLTKGYYTGDDQFNVVVTRNDVLLDTDDDTYPYAFLVYNQEGQYVNTIAENVISWKQLTKIAGEPDEAGFVCLNDGAESLHFVSLPSCENNLTLSAEIGGRRISSNYDRYPVADGDYQYVIGMGDAEEDEDSNVIAAIGWFTREGKLDHYTRFNLGVNGEYFTPLIEDYSLNPALFNTDSRHEYIYIAKIRRDDGSDLIDNVLIVADEDGKEIACYRGDDNKTLRVAAVIDYGTAAPRLVVGFYNQADGTFDVDLYPLPLAKFQQGGTGSIDDPYIIASAGDLQQIGNEPKAHYLLGNDIDLSELASSWTPIPNFSGILEGQNHVIRNLYLDSNETYVGLFGMLYEGSLLRSVNFEDVTVVLNSGNQMVGTIAGMTIKSTIDSVWVRDLRVEAEAGSSALFGGLVGQATYYSVFASDAVSEAVVELPNTSTIGGLVGETRTATTIDACYFNGAIVGNNTVGGIVGAVGKDGAVNNCHVIGDITAQSTVGGVVGSANRFGINHNYVEGVVRATAANSSSNVSLGGIIGYIESDWTKNENPAIVVRGNVMNLTRFEAPAEAKAQHRIVGFTIADEGYEEGETVRTDKGLADNYATPTIAPLGEADATTPDGADFTTLDAAFFTSIGFGYGDTAASPWCGEGAPHLYFEENNVIGGITTLPAEVPSVAPRYNLMGQPVGAAKGFVISNGKVSFLQ